MSPSEKKSMTDRLWEVTTPIFTPDMGSRLRIVRMKKKWSQAQMGDALGISQQQVGRLEAGRIQTMENPFSTAVLKRVLESHTAFVLFGSNPERYIIPAIKAAYWADKNAPKGNRTNHGHQGNSSRNS